jgi:chitodextrinase
MKSLIILTLSLLFFGNVLLAQPCSTMHVKGRFLYTAAGEKVVLRGVNEMFVYSSTDIRGAATLPQIALTGANAVRIVWNTNGSAANLDALLGNCIANKIIPMVQLDDITGNLGGLQTCLNYWKRADIVATMTKYKKWVLLNIANEAGDNTPTDAQYQTAYLGAISQLRAVGYTMPLIIDTAGYGQNENYIINNWSALLQSDPQKNCMFSLHPYWAAPTAATQARFSTLLTAVVNNNIPLIIGEGPQQKGWDCTTTIPYSWIMQQCQANGIGWLVWTWGKVQDGTVGCANNFDVTTDGIYGHWSNTWGSDVAINDANSIQKTSVRPASILGGSDTQAPTAPTALVSSGVSATGATLNWMASTDNFAVTSYDIYNGTTLVGNSLTNSFTLSNLTCGTTYSLTIKAKDCAGNVSVASSVASLKTTACTGGGSTPLVIYDESLNTNWAEAGWSWSLASRNFSNTSPVKSGTKSIKVGYNAWGGLTFRKNTTAHATTPTTVIKFWAYASSATTLSIYTASTDAGNESAAFKINPPLNQWVEYTVSMAQLGNPTQIKRINFQNFTANTATVYYDNIRLINVTGARMGIDQETATTSEIMAYPNPSSGLVNVVYHTEKAERVAIEVVNAGGLLLKTQQEQAVVGQNIFVVNMQSADAGAYFLKLYFV